MRYGAFLVMLSLLLGAGTARAQSPGVIPAPAQTEAKPAIKHVKRKPVAAKPARAKATDVKLPPAKPAAVKPAETKPAEVKLPVAKPTEAKSAPKAVAVKPVAPEKTAAAAPAMPNAPAAKAEAAPDAGIPSAERSKLQAALLWSGDYTGAAGSDDPMVTAIKSFQKRHKAKITGELTPSEHADLIAAAKAHEDEFGWSVVVDPATGIRIGLPTKLVPQARDAARGTRWSSAHGEVQVETFRITKPGLTLAALFEQEKQQPATRRVETSALHDDNFFISGMQGLKMFSVRAKMRDGEIRGFSILYDQMMESIVAPAVVAMASAFSPFPERSAPYAALARSVEYGTGLVVSAQGHIVTDLRLTQGCQVIVAAGLGDADRVAEDPENGLALLRVYGQRKISPLALAHDAPEGGKPRDQGAAFRRQRHRTAPAGAGGRIFRRRRARRAGTIPRHDGNGPGGARQRRSVRAAGAAGQRRDHPRLPSRASCGDGNCAIRRRQGFGGAGDLREEIAARYLFFHTGLRFSTKAFMPSF
jgi:hypothetical protein